MSRDTGLTTSDLLRKDSEYCSFGDTVHYADPPKIFTHCDGSYLFDERNTPYLDLQMWYSAVNLGYANKTVNNALKAQIDKLPQLACQYLHREKIELAEMVCESIQRGFGLIERQYAQHGKLPLAFHSAQVGDGRSLSAH